MRPPDFFHLVRPNCLKWTVTGLTRSLRLTVRHVRVAKICLKKRRWKAFNVCFIFALEFMCHLVNSFPTKVSSGRAMLTTWATSSPHPLVPKKMLRTMWPLMPSRSRIKKAKKKCNEWTASEFKIGPPFVALALDDGAVLPRRASRGGDLGHALAALKASSFSANGKKSFKIETTPLPDFGFLEAQSICVCDLS